MQLSLITPTFEQQTLNIILASTRFAKTCVSQFIDRQEEHTQICRNTQELLHSVRQQAPDLLILDILFIPHQTQRFCWRLQDLYPQLRIIVLGKTEAELSGCNWVYEYPNVSKACFSTHSCQVSQSPMTPDSQPTPSESHDLSKPDLYLASVVGAAVFDLSGLPREYLVTDEVDNVSWVQTVFQALGLRSLLMSSLQLDGFHYASTCSEKYRAIVVKQKDQYIALLLKPERFEQITEELIDWARTFNSDELKLYPQFRLA